MYNGLSCKGKRQSRAQPIYILILHTYFKALFTLLLLEVLFTFLLLISECANLSLHIVGGTASEPYHANNADVQSL